MAENENVAVQPQKGKSFKASLKEWFRKRVVALKLKPQTIPLVFLAITTIYFMLVLFIVSQSIYAAANNEYTSATGICTFITTLLSLLCLVSFLNAFPKRKKPNIFFIVLVFVMIAAMVACDIVYYLQMTNCMVNITGGAESAMYQTVSKGQPYIIGHLVLLGVSAVIFALLPVYSKLIRKIDTSVKLESATENMQGNIDIQED